MRRVKKTKKPDVLPINCKAAVVMQDAEGYEPDLKEWSETIEVLRGRLASLGRNKDRTADEFFTGSSPGITFPPKTDEEALDYLARGREKADINSSHQWDRRVWSDKQAKASTQLLIRSALPFGDLSIPSISLMKLRLRLYSTRRVAR